MVAGVVSAGSASEMSAYLGTPPMAAMSLRLTASARQPTSSGPQRAQVKCTPSTWMSHVATTGPAHCGTAASSPMPMVTPGPAAGTSRRSRSIRPNSPSEASGLLPGERGIDLAPNPAHGGRHIVGQGDRRDHRDARGAGADDRGRVVRRDAADADDREAHAPADLTQAGQSD